MKNNAFVGSSLKYFDCSFFSSFTAENEKLVIGCGQPFELLSIRSIAKTECYKDFISVFNYFQKIVRGEDILQIIWHNDYLLMSDLISCKIMNKRPSCPHYIARCFDKFCLQMESIRINLKWLYNFSEDFIHHSKCPNLLLFDNIAVLFPHCHTIYCHATGTINSLYISSLFEILEHINTNRTRNKSKLRKIKLADVVFFKLTDIEFLKQREVIRNRF